MVLCNQWLDLGGGNTSVSRLLRVKLDFVEKKKPHIRRYMYKVSLLQQWSATWNVIQNETEWSNSIQRFIFATNDTASSNLTGKINIILFIYEDRKKMEEGLFFIFIYILRFNLQISPLNSDWRHIWTWFSPPLMHKWTPPPHPTPDKRANLESQRLQDWW